MKFDVLTLFPEMFVALDSSITGSARERGLLDLALHDLRDWTHDRHRTVDDYAYGGGPGMVMKPEPLCEALDDIALAGSYTVFLTPSGVPFTQSVARDLARREHLVLVCGRYEGFDARALARADLELSIGDFVLTGGEIPAMAVIDALTRLQPGALGDDESSVEESFSEGLLEYPQFTRPQEYRGAVVPAILLSGDHGKIAAWRRQESIRGTAISRPDLLANAALTADERAFADAVQAESTHNDEGDSA